MQSKATKIVVLGTGGTIAGRAATAVDDLGYRAGEVGVDALVAAVPALAGQPLETEQVAQIDSKDMDHATWQRLAQRAAHHLARADVAGVVVTHGTDTLEETAWLLHRVLAPTKPLVLTAAMRPATSAHADGPQNLLDAVTVAATPAAAGVLVVFGGAVIGAADVRKVHTTRLDAIAAGDAGPIGRIEAGRLRCLRDWPQGLPLGLDVISSDPATWPWVAVIPHYAGSDPRQVKALVAAGARALVVAGTGNGSISARLTEALVEAQGQGVPVWRASRCAFGSVIDATDGAPALPSAAALSPWQARVEMLLQALARG